MQSAYSPYVRVGKFSSVFFSMKIPWKIYGKNKEIRTNKESWSAGRDVHLARSIVVSIQLPQQLFSAASDSWAFLQKLQAHFETNLLQLIAGSGIAKINIVVSILISHLQLFREKSLFYTSSSFLQLPPSTLSYSVALVKRGNPTSI